MSCPQDWWIVGVRRLLIRTGRGSDAQRPWSWYRRLSTDTHRYFGQDAAGILRCVCGSEIGRLPDPDYRRQCLRSSTDVSSSYMRRMGAVLDDYANGDLLIWVNGITENAGVVLQRPARMPDDIAQKDRTFDVRGIVTVDDLAHGIYTRQPCDPTLEGEPGEDEPRAGPATYHDEIRQFLIDLANEPSSPSSATTPIQVDDDGNVQIRLNSGEIAEVQAFYELRRAYRGGDIDAIGEKAEKDLDDMGFWIASVVASKLSGYLELAGHSHADERRSP